MNCQIFKSSHKPDTYIYLPAGAQFDSLPEELRRLFGRAEKVMAIELKENSKLAIADAGQVLREIREQGFYLQMPPSPDRIKHDPWA